MTTKEKYEMIDKSKVPSKTLEILEKMQKASTNFTNPEVNAKIDSALDRLIEGFKANNPSALITASEAKEKVKKEKTNAQKKNEGKDLSEKKDTDDKTGLPKKDTLNERKDIIKKESESEKEAQERAKKELEKENEKAKDVIETQLEKLNRIILEDPALQGFNKGFSASGGGKSTPIIDAERKALPRGARVSKKGWKNQYGASDGGRRYWENRENRSDRKSPEYETGKPYLADGGVTDGGYMAKGGITKDSIKRTLTSDTSQYFLEKDGDGYILTITPRGAMNSNFYYKFHVESLPNDNTRLKYRLSPLGYANGGYMADGENYEYVNTFKRFDSDVPVPQDDFEKLVDAYHKQLSGDKIAVAKYNVLKVQMGNYLGHKTVEEMEEYIQKTHEAHKMADGGETESEPLGNNESVYFEVYDGNRNYGIIKFQKIGSRIFETLLIGNVKAGNRRYMSYFTKNDLKLSLNRDFDVVNEVDEDYVHDRLISNEKSKPANILVVKYPYPDIAVTPDTLTLIKGGEQVFDYDPITKDFTLVSIGLSNPDQIELDDFLEDSKSVSERQYTPELIKVIEVLKENEDISEIVNELKSKGLIKKYKYTMAEGGEVDFSKKMAKMRSAYENLDMIVKSKIAMAIGIDNAISIMDYDYVVHPFQLIKGAVNSGLLEIDEINGDLVGSAIQEAERIDEDYKDSGEGIGSSDITYFTKNVLDDAGYKTAFINNRLTRVDADGNELVIDKYEMNF